VGKIEIDEARDGKQSIINPPGRIHSTREEICPNKRSHRWMQLTHSLKKRPGCRVTRCVRGSDVRSRDGGPRTSMTGLLV